MKKNYRKAPKASAFWRNNHSECGGFFACKQRRNEMNNYEIIRQKEERLQRFANALNYRLDELCEGQPEDEFDACLRKRFYPVLALYDVMSFDVDRKMYERRLEELCEGKPENEFDKWLRERFYPIVAIFTRAGKRLE